MTAPRRLLFLPGVGADPDFWRPVGERLPAHWSKRYLAWPGLGHQPPDPAVSAFEDLIGLVEAELGEAPVDILAQSMGGAVALQAALRHSARVRRIVLAVTSGGLAVADLGGADWRADYRREFPGVPDWVLDARPDYTSDLSRVSHPTLLIWGDDDPISPVAVGERLLSLLPDARLHVVKGGDHALIHDRAEDVAPLIERHIQG